MTAEQIVRDQLVRATTDVPVLPDLEQAVAAGRRRRGRRRASMALAAVVLVGVGAGGVGAVAGGDPAPARENSLAAATSAAPTDYVPGTDIDTAMAETVAERLPSLPAPDDVYPSDSRTDGSLPDDDFARAEEWQAVYSVGGSRLLVVMAAPGERPFTCEGCEAEQVAGGTLYRQAFSSADPRHRYLGVYFVRPDGSSVTILESLTATDEQTAAAQRQVSDADAAALVQDPRLWFTGPGAAQ